jgi:hypothetical protein
MRSLFSHTTKSITFMLLFALLMIYPTQIASPQVSATVVKAVPSASAPHLGETLTVDITITDVQNLYGLDVTLRWNTSVLEFQNANNQLGVESNPGGVLHEILPDASVYIAEENVSQTTGEYNLVATSVGPAPSFDGSGTIATITFTVVGLGRSELDLESELADYPPPGGSSNLIEHTDAGGSVEAVPAEAPPISIPWTLFIISLILIAFGLAIIGWALSRKRKKKNLNAPAPGMTNASSQRRS